MHTKTLSATSDNLYRLDDNTWAFYLKRSEIQSKSHSNSALQVSHSKPNLLNRIEIRVHADNYQIATVACNIIKDIGAREIESLGKSVIFDLGEDGIYAGRWKITVIKPEETLWYLFKQKIPFTKMIQENNMIPINIEKVSQNWFSSFFQQDLTQSRNVSEHFHAIINKQSFPPKIAAFDPKQPLVERLKELPFKDPFTLVATDAFQRWESKYTHQVSIHSDYRLVLRNNSIILKPNNPKHFVLEDIRANKETLLAYKNYLLKEYGEEKLKYIQYEYQFDLDNMIAKDEALTPEIVYRVNMGANNIDTQELSSTFDKLKKLYLEITSLSPHLSLTNYFEKLIQDFKTPYTIRELRALYRKASGDSLEHLQKVLETILTKNPPEKPSLLSAKNFNNLVDILAFNEEERQCAFTGREIKHKAIMGYYTLAEKKHFKPWLDLQELLQVFPHLEKKENWENYYEMLSHVAVKKHLIHQHPTDKWRVGALIPAPLSAKGEKRWYRISSCTDDNYGDFNYTLIPACKNYEKMPSIKLYRSTASDPYNMNGWDSIAADLKIAGAPGAGNRNLADTYENPFFFERTIPIWVGYLITNQKKSISEDKELPEQINFYWEKFNNYAKAVELFNQQFPEESIDIPSKQGGESYNDIPYLKRSIQALEQKLLEKAESLKELPQYKIAEDIAFVGHSLGGALAQGGMYHFGVEANRIPLPNCNFICYASDPPAITAKENKAFFAFGNTHKDLLNELGQRWKITIQMEYGDFVPQSGEEHLGATELPDYVFSEWLKTDIKVFRPLDTAIQKEISTAPTHGRRIGLAKEGIDYQLTSLTPKQLLDFDKAWWLNTDQQNIFGYKIINSPKFSEGFRRSIAVIRIPLGNTVKNIWEWASPPRGSEIRDKEGALHVAYQSPQLA